MLEQDFVKQPFLKRSAKLKRNTNGINKPHADESGARDFEKEMLCCVAMCLKKQKHNSQHNLGGGVHQATNYESICETQGEY